MSMKIEQQKPQPTWLNVRQIGTKGWNTFDDPQDIQDTQVVDAVNVVYDKGYPSPRKGSSLKWSAPVGETNNLLNLFAGRDSLGVNYPIAVYAPNMYLRDKVLNQWVPIVDPNRFVPSTQHKDLPYGYANYNYGIGNDTMYFGNGTETSAKWPVALSQLASYGVLTLTNNPANNDTATLTINGTPITITFVAPLAITFTGTPVMGQQSATLTAPFAGVTGKYPVQFQSGEIQYSHFQNGLTSTEWGIGLALSNSNANASVLSINAVTASPANGSVLIGSTTTKTATNLTALLNSPDQNNDTQYSFSVNNQTLIRYLIFVSSTNTVNLTVINTTATTVAMTITTAGDSFSFKAHPVAGDTVIAVSNGLGFPNSQNSIVIQPVGGSPTFSSYSARAGNLLTLNTALTADLVAGSSVACTIINDSNVPKGKIFVKWQQRLIVANQLGGECTIFGSESANPENFSTGANPGDPFQETITDGISGISGVTDFGDYLLVEKKDSLHKLTITTTSNGDSTYSQVININPIVSDISMGPVQPWCTIKKNNLLYYATATEGVYAINPDITGYQTSVLMDIISKPIKPYVDTLDFTNSRITAFDQKILLSASSRASGDIVLVYDILRSDLQLLRSNRNPEEGNFVWSRFTGWNVKDWLIDEDELHYGSRIDNNIYQCFVDTKLDNVNPYEVSFTTKKWDFGMPSLPKTTASVFISGTISSTEILYFDVTLSLGNQIVTLFYSISGSGNFVVTSIPAALGMKMMGLDIGGGGEIDPITGFFKVYLAIASRYGFYTMQITPHSSINGTDWGVTGFGFNINTEEKHPAVMDLGVIGDLTTTGSTTVGSGGGLITQPIRIYTDPVSGSIDGVNTIFTVPNVINSAFVLILSNSYYEPGIDFIVSGTTITMLTPPDISLAGQPFWLTHS